MEERNKIDFNYALDEFLENVSFNEKFKIKFFKKSELEKVVKPFVNHDSKSLEVDYKHLFSIAIHYITNKAGWERVNLKGINEPCYKYFNSSGF